MTKKKPKRKPKAGTVEARVYHRVHIRRTADQRVGLCGGIILHDNFAKPGAENKTPNICQVCKAKWFRLKKGIVAQGTLQKEAAKERAKLRDEEYRKAEGLHV